MKTKKFLKKLNKRWCPVCAGELVYDQELSVWNNDVRVFCEQDTCTYEINDTSFSNILALTDVHNRILTTMASEFFESYLAD